MKRFKTSKFLIFLFCFSLLLSVAFFYGNYVIASSSSQNILYIALRIVLFTFLYFISLIVFFHLLTNHSNHTILTKIHLTYWSCFFILLAFWSFHIIIKYPAGNCPDAYNQILQGLGEQTLTTHHPLFHTLLMTVFVKLGFLLGNVNIGIFLFVLLETIILDLIFSYTIMFLKRIQAPDWIVLFSLLFFALSPFITGYVGQITKDVLFSGFFVLFITVVAEYIVSPEKFWMNRKLPHLLIVSCLFTCLFRHNGVYCIVPVILVIGFLELKKKSRENQKRIISTLFLSLLLPFLISSSLEKIYQPEKGSPAEALSLPFQQTARFIKYHHVDITDEEWETLEKIFPYASKDLGYRYREDLSDPVKERYNRDASLNDLVEYFKVWFRHFKSSPACYVSATIRQNIYLLYPGYNNYSYFIDCNAGRPQWNMFTTPEWIKKLQTPYLDFLSVLHEAPVLNIVNNMAVYIIAVLAMGLLAAKARDKEYFLLLIPLYISVLVIIASPCIKGHVRYAFPIIWSSPVWIGLFSARHSK